MGKKILLVDGHSIVHRAFYGLPLLTNKDGEYTNAVYGFLTTLISSIEEEKPDYLAVAFDLSGPTFRHEKYPDYKGTRKGMPKELRPQIPMLKEVLDTMNICRFEMEGYEADDILGTLATQLEKDGFTTTILSGDRDLLQIATDQIKIRIPKTSKGKTEIEEYYAKDVIDTYGVTPDEYIDVKGLMGDTSDNIPGVPGVGEKTALRLIKEYGSMENVIDNIPNIKQKKLSENLETYKEQAISSKMLATIVKDIDMDINLADLEYSLVLSGETVELFQRLEFKNLLNRMDFENDAYETGDIEKCHVDYQLINNETDLKLLVENISNSESFAYICIMDNEELSGIGICYKDNISYWIEVCESLTIDQITSNLKVVFENKNIKKIGHNAKEDMHILAGHNIELLGLEFDTMLGAYVLNPTNSTYEIDELGHIFISESHESEEAVLGKGRKKKSIFDLEEEKRTSWISARANIVYRSYSVIDKQLKENGQEELFYKIEMPLIKVLYDMERLGIAINEEELGQYGELISSKIETITEEIYDLAGEEFNINSPKQLGIILFEKLEIPPIKRTKTGYSTAADVLEKLEKDYPIVEKVLEYRHLSKLKSTYVDGLFAVINQDTGRIHSTFNQTITSTGRISSTEPNLQNIPIKLELGRRIRKVFIPRNEEYIFVDADYSQIELRVLAHISEDPTLINAFKHNQDIHRLTASQVFDIPFDEVSDLQRNNAKAVNFGIVYGISAFSLSQDLEISRKEAQTYIDGYFAKYPKVKEYLDNIIGSTKETGYVETLFQRRRDVPEIRSSNFNVRSFGERIAMNTPIQGTAADIIKIAMIRVHKSLEDKNMKSKLILTVHDELLVEAHKDELDEVKIILQSEMENAVKLTVPIDVDLHTGDTWYDMQ